MMDVLGFHHLAIQVYKLEQVSAFYVRCLGLNEKARHHRPDGSLRSIWLGLPRGEFLAFEEVGEGPSAEPFRFPKPGLHLIALRIAAVDRAAVLAELAKHKIPVEHQTRWTVYFRDPEGNRVGLSHHPEDSSSNP
jgi:glyoxylase I family protein